MLNFSLDRWGGGSTCPHPLAESRRAKRSYLGTVDDLKTVQAEVFLPLSVSRKYLSLKGAGSRVRTDDLLITNQLLYQLSYAGLCLAGGRLVAIQTLLNRILRDPLIRYLARE
jgi:hypothetical protein